MSSSIDFVDLLRETGHTFVTGVPDSVLRGFCRTVDARRDLEHLPAANEGAAIGLAIGHHLATGKVPVVYLQNSGLWNVLNPFFTLAHESVYNIPLVLVIGWRGRPGQKDEPQHVATGERTEAILRLMGLGPFVVEHWDTATRSLALAHLQESGALGRSTAFLVPPGALDDPVIEPGPDSPHPPSSAATASRAEVIATVLRHVTPEDAIVAGIGHTGRELYAARVREESSPARLLRDFLCVGGMGYALQVAIGAARGGSRRVWCLEGDGSFLMNLGGAALAGTFDDLPLVCVLLDNAAHASVGGQPTACRNLNYAAVARTLGFGAVEEASSIVAVEGALERLLPQAGPKFLWARIANTPEAVLPRPNEPFQSRKEAVMQLFQGSLQVAEDGRNA